MVTPSQKNFTERIFQLFTIRLVPGRFNNIKRNYKEAIEQVRFTFYTNKFSD